jgi:hypothetical protein
MTFRCFVDISTSSLKLNVKMNNDFINLKEKIISFGDEYRGKEKIIDILIDYLITFDISKFSKIIEEILNYYSFTEEEKQGFEKLYNLYNNINNRVEWQNKGIDFDDIILYYENNYDFDNDIELRYNINNILKYYISLKNSNFKKLGKNYIFEIC